MIEGVAVRRLVPHRDERGSLTEILRADWPEFHRFGQAIITLNLPGVVRAWHWHTRQTDTIVVVSGKVTIGTYDARKGSPTEGRVEAHRVESDEPCAIFVPPGVWHGYKTTGDSPALIVNFPDQLYDPAKPDEGRAPEDAHTGAFDWRAE